MNTANVTVPCLVYSTPSLSCGGFLMHLYLNWPDYYYYYYFFFRLLLWFPALPFFSWLHESYMSWIYFFFLFIHFLNVCNMLCILVVQGEALWIMYGSRFHVWQWRRLAGWLAPWMGSTLRDPPHIVTTPTTSSQGKKKSSFYWKAQPAPCCVIKSDSNRTLIACFMLALCDYGCSAAGIEGQRNGEGLKGERAGLGV